MKIAVNRQCRVWLALGVAVLLVACGGGGGSGGGASSDSGVVSAGAITGETISGTNVLKVTVDSGPTGVTSRANGLYADVTICAPGTQTCQTLDHVLVDTGSVGLRVLYSALNANMQNLTRVTGDTGKPLLSCARFADGSYAWGGVVTADVNLGQKTASGIPVHLIADSLVSGTGTGASTCSSTGTAITVVSNTDGSRSALGAKGILGIGNRATDCGPSCAYSALEGNYFECTATTGAGKCSATSPSKASVASQQLRNPVTRFATDNNGLVVVLPAVTPSGADRASTLQGYVVFGVDTQANNLSTGYTALQLDSIYGSYVTARINGGSNLLSSFLDTGSNAIFFYSTMATGSTGFYTPASQTSFSVQLTGSNSASKTFSFNVKAPAFASGYSVFPMLAGNLYSSSFGSNFDGGLPFFFGRKVFIGIEGSSASNLGTPPYYGL